MNNQLQTGINIISSAKFVKVKDVSRLIRGVSYNNDELSTTPKQGYVPILRAHNINDQINFENLVYIPKKCVNEEQYIRKFDVLISMSSGSKNLVGKSAQAKTNYSASFGAFCGVLRPTNIDEKYFGFFFKSQKYRKYISNISRGINIQNIRRENLESLKIPFPPIEQQHKISSILEKTENLRLRRKQSDKLTQELLKSTFLKIFGDPQSNSLGWKVVKFNDVIELSQYGTSMKSNSNGKGYPLIGMSNITRNGKLDISNYSYVDLPKEEFKKLSLIKGDVIFNRTNSTELVGKTTYWNHDINAVLASYLVKIKLKPVVNPIFFVYLLNTDYFKRLFRVRSRKAVNQSNISPTLLRKFRMYLPPIELQNLFANTVKGIEKIEKYQIQSKSEIANYRNLFIQTVFGGRDSC